MIRLGFEHNAITAVSEDEDGLLAADPDRVLASNIHQT